MSFQAYLDNINAKTGKTPEEFKKLAKKQGLRKPGVKAGAVFGWLKRPEVPRTNEVAGVSSLFRD